MKLSHLVSFTLTLVAGAAACGESKDASIGTLSGGPVVDPAPAVGGPAGSTGAVAATATPDQAALLVDLASVQTTVCACPDRACVEQAIAAGAPFDRRLDTMYEDEAAIPAPVKVEVDAIQARIEACTTRIGGVNPPLSAATTRVLAQFDALAATTCECGDRACADVAQQRWDVLAVALKASAKPSGDIPEGVVARMAIAQGRAKACVDKLPS